MSSPLSDDDQESLWKTFGDEGTYTPISGDPATVYAIVDRGAGSLTDEAGIVIQEADALTFLRSDLDPPAQGATWTDGTTTWTLGDVLDRDEIEVRVRARRS